MNPDQTPLFNILTAVSGALCFVILADIRCQLNKLFALKDDHEKRLVAVETRCKEKHGQVAALVLGFGLGVGLLVVSACHSPVIQTGGSVNVVNLEGAQPPPVDPQGVSIPYSASSPSQNVKTPQTAPGGVPLPSRKTEKKHTINVSTGTGNATTTGNGSDVSARSLANMLPKMSTLTKFLIAGVLGVLAFFALVCIFTKNTPAALWRLIWAAL